MNELKLSLKFLLKNCLKLINKLIKCCYCEYLPVFLIMWITIENDAYTYILNFDIFDFRIIVGVKYL